MIRVGQCEACQAWCLARRLEAARVTRPLLEHRRARVDAGGVPGWPPEPDVAYFCAECAEAIRSEPTGGSTIIRPGEPEFHAAREPG